MEDLGLQIFILKVLLKSIKSFSLSPWEPKITEWPERGGEEETRRNVITYQLWVAGSE